MATPKSGLATVFLFIAESHPQARQQPAPPPYTTTPPKARRTCQKIPQNPRAPSAQARPIHGNDKGTPRSHKISPQSTPRVPPLRTYFPEHLQQTRKLSPSTAIISPHHATPQHFTAHPLSYSSISFTLPAKFGAAQRDNLKQLQKRCLTAPPLRGREQGEIAKPPRLNTF